MNPYLEITLSEQWQQLLTQGVWIHRHTRMHSIAGFEVTSSHIKLRINHSKGEVQQLFTGVQK